LGERGILVDQSTIYRWVQRFLPLIAGHRRAAAIQQLASEAPEDPRWRKILAVERIADEDQAFVLALVENLHREDLPAQDEASALEALEQELGSLQAVANAIKRSKAYVSRRVCDVVGCCARAARQTADSVGRPPRVRQLEQALPST